MIDVVRQTWRDHRLEIATHAVMLAVILVLVVGAIRLFGTSASCFLFLPLRFSDTTGSGLSLQVEEVGDQAGSIDQNGN